MNVKIFQESKNAMQSGRARVGQWLLEYDEPSRRVAEPLMGWTSSDDTLNQVQLKFSSREDAIAFAEKKGWDYIVQQPHQRHVKPRNYSDNFK